MNKIQVKPEGREGVWLADKASLIDFINTYPEETIHNFMPSGMALLGADWEKESVIEKINESDRIAVLTGDSLSNNRNHALAVVTGAQLFMFDIGNITEDNLTEA